MRVVRLLGALAVLAVLAPVGPVLAEKVKTEQIEGYAEYRSGDFLIVDGQRLTATPATKMKGENLDLNTVPLGYEVKAKGVRQRDGSLQAVELELKANGSSMFEGEALRATGEMEQAFLRLGRLPREMGGAPLRTSGPQVDRVRRIASRVMPPYRSIDEFRLYVSGDWEWNAFACANGMIVVYNGLLEEMDDDEVALVIAHEIAHATHEHTRRQMKKGLWTALAAAGVQAAAQNIKDEELRAMAQTAAALGALAWNNGFSRGLEDQADRVGMRYAYEAGFDVTKAPRLWRRFAQKYGDSDKVTNFFFGNHSLSLERATNAERLIAMDYRDARGASGVRRADGRSSVPRQGAVRSAYPVAAGESDGDTQWVESLVAKSGVLEDDGTFAKSIDGELPVKAGMTPDEVRAAVGKPMLEIEDTWIYSRLTVLFADGKVKDVQEAKTTDATETKG